MPNAPIVMPQLGESIAEATVVAWLVQPGDNVRSGQDVMEVETNKATMTVAAPCNGRVVAIAARPGQSYPVGCVLGQLEVTEEEVARLGLDLQPTSAGRSATATTGEVGGEAAPAPTRVEPTVRGLPVPASAGGATYMSPRMKARMHELGLHAADLAGLAGSGAGGRVTVDDLERFLANLSQQRLSDASSMRVAVADAMRRSWTRPLATVGMAVCLDPLLAHRRTLDPRPGPALYALRALALALAENSAPAGRLVGAKIVHPASIDVGFAVEAEDGVLVPIIRAADRRSLQELAPLYNDLVAKTRERRLPPEAIGSCVATVTNFGTFGLMWATPIPLPEQTLVLGLGAGRKVPSWEEARGQFVPITEAGLTLSFDHRVLDGGAAGRLLARVAGLMSEPARL